ncbi:hypothetical protein J1614_010338 [Plenodomus biglobosus]|nr:hypothetical protein J1614_010338 [Plenodomus biglobosus]
MAGIMKAACFSCVALFMGGVDAIPFKHYENQQTTTSVAYRLPILLRGERSFRNETSISSTLADTPLFVDISSTSDASTNLPSTSSSTFSTVTTSMSSSPDGPMTTIRETSSASESLRGSSIGPTSSTAKDGSEILLSSSIPQQSSSIIVTHSTSSLRHMPQPSPTLVISKAASSHVVLSASSASDGRALISTSLQDVTGSQSTLISSQITPFESDVFSMVQPTRQPPFFSTLLVVPTTSLQTASEPVSSTSTSLQRLTSFESEFQYSSVVVLTGSLSSSTPSSQASLTSSQASWIHISTDKSSASSSLAASFISTPSTATTAVTPTSTMSNGVSSLAKQSNSSGQWSSGSGILPTAILGSSQTTSVPSSSSTLGGPTSLISVTPVKSEDLLKGTVNPLPHSQSSLLSGLSLDLAKSSTINSPLQFATSTSVQSTSSIATVSPSSIALTIALSSFGMNQTDSALPTPFAGSKISVSAIPAVPELSIVSRLRSTIVPAVTGNDTTPTSTVSLKLSSAIPHLSTMIANITSQSTWSAMRSSPTPHPSNPDPKTISLVATSASPHGNSSITPSYGPSPQTLNVTAISPIASAIPTAGLNSSSTTIAERVPSFAQTSAKAMIRNTTSLISSQAATTTTTFPLGSSSPTNFQPVISTTRLFSATPQPSNANQTRMENSLSKSFQYNISNANSTPVTLSSVQSDSLQSASSFSTASLSAHTSVSESRFNSRPSRTVIPIYPPIPSASQSMAAAPAPDPPILTPSQTAIVAAASFAGVLLAAIAVIYLVRRYHSARAARPPSTSTESSSYPKLGYLYDPAIPRGSIPDDDSDDDAPALMSGGAGGLRSQSAFGAPADSLESTEEPYNDSSPFSDPGNPFRSPGGYTQTSVELLDSSLRASVEATAVLKAIVDEQQYALASQWSTTTSASSTPTQAFHDHIIPSPTLSPFMGRLRRSHVRTGSKGSVKSRRQFMATSTHTAQSGVATSHRPQSLHARYSYHSQTSPRESGASDPFEHDIDLPLRIDSRTETQDSVIVYAPSPTGKFTRRPLWPNTTNDGNVPAKPPFTRFNSNNPYRLQPQSADAKTDSPQGKQHHATPSTHSPTNISPSSPQSPLSPPYAPIHLGWDDIKRLSKGSSTIVSPMSPLSSYSVFPPLLSPNSSTPPKKKKSLIQLRRKDSSFPGPGTPKSPIVAGLNITIPFANKQGLGIVDYEGPKESFLARYNSLTGSRGGADAKRVI